MVKSIVIGTDKLKSIVIGKSENPRAFKNVPDRKVLPCTYYHQNKAWMSATIFKQIIDNFASHLKRNKPDQKKNILLIDSAPAHTGSDKWEYNNLVIRFLPVNCTSHLQPLDAGIIRSAKAHYKRELVLRTLQMHEIEQNVPPLDIKEAIYIFARAWKAVTKETIKNCWRVTDILPASLSADIRMDEQVRIDVEDELVENMAALFNTFSLECKWEKQDVLDYLDMETGEFTEKEETEEDMVTQMLQNHGGGGEGFPSSLERNCFCSSSYYSHSSRLFGSKL